MAKLQRSGLTARAAGPENGLGRPTNICPILRVVADVLKTTDVFRTKRNEVAQSRRRVAPSA
jgi:hypothetical protein